MFVGGAIYNQWSSDTEIRAANDAPAREKTILRGISQAQDKKLVVGQKIRRNRSVRRSAAPSRPWPCSVVAAPPQRAEDAQRRAMQAANGRDRRWLRVDGDPSPGAEPPGFRNDGTRLQPVSSTSMRQDDPRIVSSLQSLPCRADGLQPPVVE
ncbi:hypothetical protein mvi_33670 [Methylobacterium indicum]|uniref:Uncharacterized protein n=1 Tax=Methylobacterium indicum TaxID=1775910 RepID=A0A8H9C7L2_9HYPH|nr:hypothetical protein mvi_33670 [Methylobacterium indicum]